MPPTRVITVVSLKNKPGSNEGIWADIESKWLNLYKERKAVTGISINHRISASDEWLAEAYMETDYSTLAKKDFVKTIKKFVAHRYTEDDNN